MQSQGLHSWQSLNVLLSSDQETNPCPLLFSPRWKLLFTPSKKSQPYFQLVFFQVRYFPPCIFFGSSYLNFCKVLTVEKEDSFFLSKPVAYTMLTMPPFCRTYSINYFQLFHISKNFVSNFFLFPINIFVSSLNCCYVSFSVAFYAPSSFLNQLMIP